MREERARVGLVIAANKEATEPMVPSGKFAARMAYVSLWNA
jgi:hypothetical protein